MRVRSAWLVAACAAAMMCSVGPAYAQSASASRRTTPNVVILFADDMSPGDLTCYNAQAAWKTPNLDRLAREGLRCDDAHSTSAVCTPSRYGLLTGRYAWRGDLKSGVLQGESPALLEPKRLTLAEFLAAEGYETAMFGKWHLGLDWVREKKAPVYDEPFAGGPVAHGFKTFHGISASLDMAPYVFLKQNALDEPLTRDSAAQGLSNDAHRQARRDVRSRRGSSDDRRRRGGLHP
ncbi:MAG: sulfatase-like hydrolase/transferase [Pirellulales bacterium]